MYRRNSRPRRRRLLVGLVTAIGLMLVLLTPTLANGTTDQVTKPNGPLTASWWQEFVGNTDAKYLQGVRGRDSKGCISDWNNWRILY